MSKTRYAMLGFLGWRPMSGYDIKSLVDESLAWFWSISYGQIYPTLKKLVEQGAATVQRDEDSGGRIRDVYSITPKGRESLREWMKTPVDMGSERDEMQLKLFLGGQMDPDITLDLIRDFREKQVARKEELESEFEETKGWIEAGEYPEAYKWLIPEGTGGHERRSAVREQALIFLLSMRQGILKAESRIAWCTEAEQLLQDPPFSRTREDADAID